MPMVVSGPRLSGERPERHRIAVLGWNRGVAN
jgi:hypothetical protein